MKITASKGLSVYYPYISQKDCLLNEDYLKLTTNESKRVKTTSALTLTTFGVQILNCYISKEGETSRGPAVKVFSTMR